MGLLGNNNIAGAWLKAWAWFTFKLDYYGNDGMPSKLSWCDFLIEGPGMKTGLFGQHKFHHYRRWMRGPLAEFLRDSVFVVESFPWRASDDVVPAVDTAAICFRNRSDVGWNCGDFFVDSSHRRHQAIWAINPGRT